MNGIIIIRGEFSEEFVESVIETIQAEELSLSMGVKELADDDSITLKELEEILDARLGEKHG